MTLNRRYGRRKTKRCARPTPRRIPSVIHSASTARQTRADYDADLGSSLYEVLTIIRNDRTTYPNVDFYFDKRQPLETPSIITLPAQGLRFRFDGPDQRLRLIEVQDLKKARVAYKDSELVKTSDSENGSAFKRIYQLFGPTYDGEYFAPANGLYGEYTLSWEGLAFRFSVLHSTYSPEKDFVSLLSSSVATRMAVFEGGSWADMRKELFTRTPTGPRISSATRSRDSIPAELELARIRGEGTIEFLRRNPAPPFYLKINETSLQDLITWLGPPDVKHKANIQSQRQDTPMQRRTGSTSQATANGRAPAGSQPSSYSSTNTDTYDVDFESGDIEDDATDTAAREEFWCYFNQGLDILTGPATKTPYGLPSPSSDGGGIAHPSPHLVVKKVILHGNVPGSYAFNRHRRLRWQICLPNTEFAGDLTSETKFYDLNAALIFILPAAPDIGKGKVVNRTWGAGATDSSFFLPDAEEDLVEGNGSENWIGNTKVYTYPGLVVEVGDNDAVSALTVY